MLKAIDASNNGILALEAIPFSEYICPVCREEVILKKGKLRIAHFAHQKHSDCSTFSEGETKEHLQGKSDLYEWISHTEAAVHLEVFIPEIKQRPDLLITHKKAVVAVEYQCSPISIKDICKRTKGYHSIGMKVIWIAGSKLAVRGKLTALHRSLVGSDEKDEFYFLYYDVLKKQLLKYTIHDPLICNVEPDPSWLLGLSDQDEKVAFPIKYEHSTVSLKEIERNLSRLQFMSFYKNRYYADFFQLLYENHLELNKLPHEIHHSLASDWMIKTVSYEWKLRVMIWLKSLSLNQVVTKRLLIIQMRSLVREEHLVLFNCPNITADCYERPLFEFMEVLVHSNYLRSVKPYKWRLNEQHPFIKKMSSSK